MAMGRWFGHRLAPPGCLRFHWFSAAPGGATPPGTRTPMSEHVSGDRLAIQATLDWLDRLDGQVRNLAAAIKPAIRQDCLGEEARRVILARVSHEARMMLKPLRDYRWQAVVSPQVVALVEPVLREATLACFPLWKYPGLI